MEQIEELLCNVTEELENQFRTTGTIGNMPRVPMMILYAGECAYQSKNNISDTLRQVWRKREDAICHLKLEEEFDIPEFQHLVDGVYDKENCFHNMNDLFLCFIFDTRDYENIDSFKNTYKKVEKIKEYSGEPYCLTMSIVLMDESASGSGLSIAVKSYLREQLENKTMPYRSTVILSNRMYNGARLKGERIRENYDLAGTILLLANSEGADYSAPISVIFPAEHNAYYLTASYSRINRQNRKICEFVLHRILGWMEEQLVEGKGLTLDDLCKKLEFAGGKSKFLTEFFEKEIKKNLPSKDALEYLPRISKDMNGISNRSYRFFNHETMGCAELFYQGEFLPWIEKVNESFLEQFQQYLHVKLSMGEAATTLSENMIQNILQQLCLKTPSEETGAYQYLIERAEIDFIERILPECKLQLQNLRKTAKSCIQQLSDLIQEFQEGFFTDTDEMNMKQYYEELTAQFLSKPESEQILEKFNKTNGDKEKILELLREVMESIESYYPIFSASLIEEMIIRMGQDPRVIQEILQNELMSSIEGKIRLRPHSALSMLQEFFIVNQKNKNGNKDRFFSYLQQLKKDQNTVAFLDSGNDNSIGMVSLYRCDAGTLM